MKGVSEKYGIAGKLGDLIGDGLSDIQRRYRRPRRNQLRRKHQHDGNHQDYPSTSSRPQPLSQCCSSSRPPRLPSIHLTPSSAGFRSISSASSGPRGFRHADKKVDPLRRKNLSVIANDSDHRPEVVSWEVFLFGIDLPDCHRSDFRIFLNAVYELIDFFARMLKKEA